MPDERAAHRPLAGFLARAVDTERLHRVVFAIGAGLAAVEHVIGRDVDQRDRGVMAGGGEVGGAGAIAGPSRVRLALGAVDRGIGRGIDDDVGALARHRSEHRLALRNVEPR